MPPIRMRRPGDFSVPRNCKRLISFAANRQNCSRLTKSWSSSGHAHERAAIEHRTKYAVVGSPEIVRQRFREILEETRADELIVTAQIFDHAARLRSFEIGAEILRNISAA